MIGAQAYYRNCGFYISSEIESGRRAFCSAMNPRREPRWSVARSENAGTSNRKTGENPVRRNTKVSFAMVISEGLVGPKGIPNGGPDG
jgi:hypothetical protein